MFGKLLNVITIPARAVVSPIKLTANLFRDGEDSIDSVVDSIRYITTAEEDLKVMNGLLNFDDED